MGAEGVGSRPCSRSWQGKDASQHSRPNTVLCAGATTVFAPEANQISLIPSREVFFFLNYSLFFKIVIKNICCNWLMTALQYWFDICHTSTWINHRYTYVPSLLNLPRTSHPSRLLWSPSWSSLSHTANSHWLSIYVCECNTKQSFKSTLLPVAERRRGRKEGVMFFFLGAVLWDM